MFEQYTEKARRVIFFARYEASQFGSPYIATEHLLLALFREDKSMFSHLLTGSQMAEIRREIESRTVIREKVSTSVDLPLSNESKRILSHAAEFADWAGQRHVGTEHLLAGLLREERCFAATLLTAHGVTLEAVRTEIKSSQPDRVGEFTSGYIAVGSEGEPTVWISFQCGGETVGEASGIAAQAIPRVGERVTLLRQNAEKTYRVLDVGYAYFNGAAPAEPVPGAGPNVTVVVPPDPRNTFVLTSIHVQVEAV